MENIIEPVQYLSVCGFSSKICRKDMRGEILNRLLDRERKKRERNSTNVDKREPTFTNSTDNDNDIDNDNNNDIDNDIDNDNETSVSGKPDRTSKPPKSLKHKFGEYGHVYKYFTLRFHRSLKAHVQTGH